MNALINTTLTAMRSWVPYAASWAAFLEGACAFEMHPYPLKDPGRLDRTGPDARLASGACRPNPDSASANESHTQRRGSDGECGQPRQATGRSLAMHDA